MIVVTGATGRLGSRIVRRLLDHVPASDLGVTVRDPERAADLARRGVRVRPADFTDPAGLEAGFDGASQVLVVSAAIAGPEAVAANCAALDAAVRAGAGRVLYTSHQAASPDSRFAPQPVHAATEAHLAGLGVPFTALRNGFYASTLEYYLGDVATTGRVVTPQDGPVSWTDHDDLADAAVAALLDDTLLDGVTPPLTASATATFADVARVAAEVLGRPVDHVVLDDEAWTAAAVEAGMPARAAEFTLGLFRAARDGEFDVVDPTLERVLGRPPVPVRATVERLLGDA